MQRALTLDSTCDFSRFDSRMREEAQPKTREKVKSEAKVKTAVREEDPVKVKPVMSVFAVVAWVICMALLLGIVYSYMILAETADGVNTAQAELTAMREETQLLEIKKEQKYGANQIQEIAVNQLGMQKIQKSQITYVDTNTGDYTEVARNKAKNTEGSGILAGIASGFNTFIEYIN